MKLDIWVYFKFQLELLDLDVCGINHRFLSKIGQNREIELAGEARNYLAKIDSLNSRIYPNLKHIVEHTLKFPEH